MKARILSLVSATLAAALFATAATPQTFLYRYKKDVSSSAGGTGGGRRAGRRHRMPVTRPRVPGFRHRPHPSVPESGRLVPTAESRHGRNRSGSRGVGKSE